MFDTVTLKFCILFFQIVSVINLFFCFCFKGMLLFLLLLWPAWPVQWESTLAQSFWLYLLKLLRCANDVLTSVSIVFRKLLHQVIYPSSFFPPVLRMSTTKRTIFP